MICNKTLAASVKDLSKKTGVQESLLLELGTVP